MAPLKLSQHLSSLIIMDYQWNKLHCELLLVYWFSIYPKSYRKLNPFTVMNTVDNFNIDYTSGLELPINSSLLSATLYLPLLQH
jgi:hypothetical protein